MSAERKAVDMDTYEKPAHGWTCFHCGETFTTAGGARAHFGAEAHAIPGCIARVQLGAERGLLMNLREAEEQIAKYMAEDTALARSMHAAQTRHASALTHAEELGFERGLRAGLNEPRDAAVVELIESIPALLAVARGDAPVALGVIERAEAALAAVRGEPI